ncbi:membrane dipeptidase [Janibacter melonis]|uniref:Membrane dipeptidase n=1 Tax=Janibacter melonis TaxID=262209 RepID=A0A5P8FJ33_9MICO|nr:dipeptidase [Janibacter melonis]QFQ29569.2 membrane dipeptidase [Janibacter melonis]
MASPDITGIRVLDGHNDLPWHHREIAGYDLDRCDIALEQPELHTDLPRMRAGGLAAQLWSVWVPCELPGEAAVTATHEQVDFVEAMCARYEEMELARTAADVERVWEQGRHAALLGMEGGHSIDGSLEHLAAFAARGVRYMTLTHNDNTAWADSATDERVHGGLTDFGREVVRTMNALGVAVDLSHVSAETMHHALDETSRPVLFSHSNALALCSHPRNVPDDVLERMPGNGGVVMANFVPYFLREDWAQWRLGGFKGKAPAPATAADVVAHLEHLREVVGIEHVGLGGDFDGVDVLPADLGDVSRYPHLLGALAERGWSRADLEALAHGNALRVLRDTEV